MKCKHPTCGDTCRRPKTAKKRKPIAKRSITMKDKMKLYNLIRARFLKDNPVCVVTGKPATEIHHAAGRVGAYLLNTKFFKSVSREGHIWIHENPAEALEKGFSVSRLSKRV